MRVRSPFRNVFLFCALVTTIAVLGHGIGLWVLVVLGAVALIALVRLALWWVREPRPIRR